MSQDVARHSMRLLGELRAFGANYAEFTARFAAWLGLGATDAAALSEILFAEDQGEPLTPTRLAQRLGRTTGATTNVINRLEREALVVRTRENSDRRVVTLRTGDGIRKPAREFFGPLNERFESLVARHSPELLDQVDGLLRELRMAMDALLAEDNPRPRR